MDVTVNIRGNAQGLRDELENVSNTPDVDVPGREPDASRQPLPPSDRLIDDIRREIAEQRNSVVSTTNRAALDLVSQSQREAMNRDISARYDARRSDAQSRLEAQYGKIDEDMERMRQRGITNLGDKADDPFYQSVLNQQIEDERTRRYKKVGTMFDAEFDEIDRQEGEEKANAERELTDAIKRLTGEMERKDRQEASGGDPNSYINRLRQQRRELLQERDNAPDEAGALAAQGRINAIDDQLRRVMQRSTEGGGGRGGIGGDNVLQAGMGLENLFSGMKNGNLGGAISGAGLSIAGISGMSPAAMMRFMGWVGLAAGAAEIATGLGKGYDQLGDLSAFRSTAGGMRGAAASGFLSSNLDSVNAWGVDYGDLGMKRDEFIAEARKRVAARGMADEWGQETVGQIALERQYALNQGALMQGSRYDRYGTNVTDAISQLVTLLTGIQGSGVTTSDFTRVQEKFDIQQQIMASYLGRTDRPDYGVANNILGAFSSTGVTQDSRMGGDIQTFQNAIQNPMNERMKAIVYGTVADLFPETGGDMAQIDRRLKDPKNEGRIMQAVVKRIEEMFGGTDTTMGYFAFQSIFPGISPDRLDKYVSDISSGQAGALLFNGPRNQDQINADALQNKKTLIEETPELLSGISRGIASISNAVTNTGVKIAWGSGVKPNVTNDGN